MKKTILALLLLVAVSPAYSLDVITRSDRGLFGYREITESHDAANGINYLYCTNPGKSSCKWAKLTSNNDKYEDIVLRVDGECSQGSVAGSFEKGDYYVRYTFDRDSDVLTIYIYSREEAIGLGYI